MDITASYFADNSSEFRPQQVAGLVLWLKADTIGQADASAVTTWSDLSASATNATQGTGVNQPTYKTNIVNGKPIVRFDGTNSVLAITSSNLNSSNKTIFVVAKPTADLAGTSVLLARSTADWYVAGAAANMGFTSHSNGTPAQQTTSSTPTVMYSSAAFKIGTYRWNISGSDVIHDMYSNGTSIKNITYSASGYTAGVTTAWALGAFAQTPSLGFPGDIGEVLVYNSALAAADRQRVERYLGKRYAISVP